MGSRHVWATQCIQGQPEQLCQTLSLKIIERWDHCVVIGACLAWRSPRFCTIFVFVQRKIFPNGIFMP